MGWTFYNVSRRDKTQDIVLREFTQKPTEENGFLSFSIEDHSMVGSTFYGLMKRQKGNDEPVYFGFVCLTSRKNMEGYSTEFGYKDMDESCGPYQTKCPKRIIHKLNELSPNPSEYARKWRQACLDQSSKPKTQWQENDIAIFNGKRYRLTYKASARKGWHAIELESRIQYRIPFSYLAKSTKENNT